MLNLNHSHLVELNLCATHTRHSCRKGEPSAPQQSWVLETMQAVFLWQSPENILQCSTEMHTVAINLSGCYQVHRLTCKKIKWRCFGVPELSQLRSEKTHVHVHFKDSKWQRLHVVGGCGCFPLAVVLDLAGWAAWERLPYCCPWCPSLHRNRLLEGDSDTLTTGKAQLQKKGQKNSEEKSHLAFFMSSKFLNPPPPIHPTNTNQGINGIIIWNILNGASAPISYICYWMILPSAKLKFTVVLIEVTFLCVCFVLLGRRRFLLLENKTSIMSFCAYISLMLKQNIIIGGC